MEQLRRNLRNYNKCQQINNVFNIKTSQTNLIRHLPPQILLQIGKLQKISCCNINSLSELHPQSSIQEELEKCRAAQLSLSSISTCQDNNPNAQSAVNKQAAKKQGVVCANSLFCKEQYESREQICYLEKEQNQCEIWKDMELVDKLNDYFMFGGNERFKMNHQLFQK